MQIEQTHRVRHCGAAAADFLSDVLLAHSEFAGEPRIRLRFLDRIQIRTLQILDQGKLKDLQIGMPVDLYVDAYPKKVFKGRVAGFLPGTGQSETLLPPENATGNYIKVTQRLPVRIELVEPAPTDTPLFIGLSVVPYVKFTEKPTGPDAGQRLHPDQYRQHPDAGGGPAGKQLRNRIEVEAGAAGGS